VYSCRLLYNDLSLGCECEQTPECAPIVAAFVYLGGGGGEIDVRKRLLWNCASLNGVTGVGYCGQYKSRQVRKRKYYCFYYCTVKLHTKSKPDSEGN
jgi:hypothetical protein